MLLAELLHEAGLNWTAAGQPPAVQIHAVRYDSRAVQPGDIFVAVRGTVTDGHRHIGMAVEAGAALVVLADAAYAIANPPSLLVDSTRAALADLAAAIHSFPALDLRVTGITGTDGKTTSAYLLCHVLDALGTSTGLLSTVAFKYGERWAENTLRQSTLEAPEIQDAMASMRETGVTDAVIEATSHGLALRRVRNCYFDDAIVTNITSEHLEFHGTRERYIAAKRLLLQDLADNVRKHWRRFAAVNIDDDGSASLLPDSPVDTVTFGIGERADVRASAVAQTATGTTFTISAAGQSTGAFTTLPGLFNVSNCLGVIALLHGRGVPLDMAVPHLASFSGVPGRMRKIEMGQPFMVVVDYAHTAASLEKVLLTLRPLSSGKLIAVFGSAGDRDREKRSAMGAVATGLADYCIFTDEDPRWEDSLAILRDIAEGARLAGGVEGRSFQLVPDRTAAIGHGIAMAQPGDVVLLAGKGHEQSMIVAGKSLPWDDQSVAAAALRARGFDAQ